MSIHNRVVPRKLEPSTALAKNQWSNQIGSVGNRPNFIEKLGTLANILPLKHILEVFLSSVGYM